jgi:lycopene beta-cyclase
MAMPRYDAVVAGGGLSGLSLAAHLAARGWADRSVLVVDRGPAHRSAVCWAFWSGRPGLLDAAVSRSYSGVRIHAAGRDRILSLDPYRYHVVRRADLGEAVRRLLDRCPGFELRTGTVESLRDNGCVTVDGRTVRGGWVFDSVRPAPAGPARMAFTGWEVRCARPVFDPELPVLFDFRVPQAGGARFGYVLPEDRYRALVELTAFVPRRGRPPPAAERDDALAGYLSDVLYAGDYTVLRTESAVLPLGTRPVRRRHGRVLAIGTSAGLVKASTGYAYQRIQRDSAAIAQSFVRYGDPWHTARPLRRYRLLDAVLLDVLDHDPAQLELAFARLFAANPASRVLRFLDEDTGLPDVLRLMAALPPLPYLRALARLGYRGPAG